LQGPNYQAIRVAKKYVIFLWYENQISLILGKNYHVLNVIFRILDLLKTTDNAPLIEAFKLANPETSDCQEADILKVLRSTKTDVVIKTLDDSITDLRNKYPALVETPADFLKSVGESNGVSVFGNLVLKFLNDTAYAFSFFVSAYDLLCGEDKTRVFEGPIKEFGNYLSHLTMGCVVDGKFDENLKKANSHLYRGALDCYKQYIISKKDIFPGRAELFAEMINIRVSESQLIGCDETHTDKQSLLEKYESLCSKLSI
jgi:hypothetical protein